MRLRNVPGSRELITVNNRCIQNPEKYRGQWKDLFHNSNPLHIEIGMGKGDFLLALAKQNPAINYIGIEKYSAVLLRALEKMEDKVKNENNLYHNLRLIRMDAEEITKVFDQNEVSRIYLNFSDPWPKDRHAKRRLTSVQFLQRYDRILTINGSIEFKTDNTDLFAFSLEQISLTNWQVKAFTRDLHHDPNLNSGNIMTEYEKKFSSLGHPICKLIAYREFIALGNSLP